MSSSDEKTLMEKAQAYVKRFIRDIDAKEVAVLIIFGFIVFVIFKMMLGGIFGLSLVVIENGPMSSMWPTYDQGDMFLINKCSPEKIQIGDVIVYVSDTPLSRGTLIIHRVVNITTIDAAQGLDYYYRVSGDNPNSNTYVDDYNSTTSLIPYDAVVGKTVFCIKKIGYLRLWLADNPVIRIVILVAIVGLGAYLILAPDKKKEEEAASVIPAKKETKEKKEFKIRVKEYFVTTWKNTKKWFIELFTVKKQRIKLIIFVSVILSLVIFIPVIDNAIGNKELTTGIDDISFRTLDDTRALNPDYIVAEGIVFVPFTIYFKHDGSWNQVIKCFTVEGIQNGTVLATSHWYSYYQVEGDNGIGGSLVFNDSEFNSSLDLTIRIKYSIHKKFGQDINDLVYEETFDSSLL
jgi:signal peptidase I